MISVLYTQIGERLSRRNMDLCLERMPVAVRSQINRYRRWEDQQAGLFGKLLLLEGMKRCGYPVGHLQQLSWDGRGRPFLEDGLDFNISHSGEYVICALSSKGRVGIDIEKIRLIDIGNFRTQMSSYQWKATMAAENRLVSFFNLWTQKEAVIKADGRGIAIPLDEIIIKGDEAYIEGSVWKLREMKIADGYCCHMAINEKNANMCMEKIACFPVDYN